MPSNIMGDYEIRQAAIRERTNSALLALRAAQQAVRTFQAQYPAFAFINTSGAQSYYRAYRLPLDQIDNAADLYSALTLAAFTLQDLWRDGQSTNKHALAANRRASWLCVVLSRAMLQTAAIYRALLSNGPMLTRSCVTYARMVTEAQILGWPYHYREDLYVHDLAYCREYVKALGSGYWCIRPSGTHIGTSYSDTILASFRTFGTLARYYRFSPHGGLELIDYATVAIAARAEKAQRIGW